MPAWRRDGSAHRIRQSETDCEQHDGVRTIAEPVDHARRCREVSSTAGGLVRPAARGVRHPDRSAANIGQRAANRHRISGDSLRRSRGQRGRTRRGIVANSLEFPPLSRLIVFCGTCLAGPNPVPQAQISRRQHPSLTLPFLVIAAAFAATRCSSNSGGLSTSPSSAAGPATGGSAVATVQITVNPNPVAFSGAPITDTAECANYVNTWFYDTVLQETGGGNATFTSRSTCSTARRPTTSRA